MTLYFLKELSRKPGDTYVTDPVEIAWVRQLKQRGLVDAEIGPPVLTQYPTKPARYAIVRGLTDAGQSALGIPAFLRPSFWRQIFGLKPVPLPGSRHSSSAVTGKTPTVSRQLYIADPSHRPDNTDQTMNTIRPPPDNNDQLSMLGEEDPGSAFDSIFHSADGDPATPTPRPSMHRLVWTSLVLLLGGLAVQRWMSGRHASKPT
nr:hypothetical protein [uncultured Albidiferax sp.]